MAKKTVNIGTSVNKGDGDPLRTAFGKINDNFNEIYGAIGSDGSIFNPLSVDSNILPDADNTRDLGSPDKRWRDIFVAPGSLYIGDIKLSNNNGTLVVQQVTDAGLVTETPVGEPGSVTTDRLVNGAYTVSLDTNGNLTFPQGTLLGYSDPGGFIIDGAVDKDIAIYTYNGADAHGWTFGTDGKLTLPEGGDIVDSNGTSVLGGGAGGGLSISDFGEGFVDNLDAGKITTSKLYNENPNQGLNNQYTLEVTNGGVVVLPDGSIINGSTIRGVAGTGELNYTGITIGPNSNDAEKTWMWVDHANAYISTNNFANTWTFGTNGNLTLPEGGDIVDSNGTSVLGGTGGSGDSLVNGDSSFSMSPDGTLTLTHPAEPNYHPLSTTLTIQKAAGNYHTISGAYGLSLQATPVPSGYGLNTNTNFVDIFHDGVSVNVNDNTWGFGTDGLLTIPGNIHKTTDASIVVGGGSTIENVEVNAVDEQVPPGGVWRLFIGVDAYPTLGDIVQIGDTVTTSWGTPITATIVDIQQDDDWKIHVDQDITAGHNDYDTVTFTPASGKTWTFDTDGDLTLPAGGDILDSEGNSVLGVDNNNIWVQTFVSNAPTTDFPQIATSIEYDDNGNVIALFSHSLPDLGDNGGRYYSVGKYTDTGTKIWTAKFADALNTDGWGLAVDNADGWVYVAGQTNGAPDYAYDVSTLTKIDSSDGSVEWSTIYDFGVNSSSAVVDVDSDGNPVMIGYANTLNNEGYLTITKVDKTNGSVTWTRKLDGQANEQAYGMAMGPDGEIVAVGYMDNLNYPEPYRTIVTLTATPGSDPDWTTDLIGVTSGGLTYDVTFAGGVPTFSNIVDTDGNRYEGDLLVTFNADQLGPTGSTNMEVRVGTTTGEDMSDRMVVVKYASDGTIAWQKAIQFDADYDCSGADADIDSNGNIYICGQFEIDGGGTGMALVKFNSSGAKQWSRRVVGDCATTATSIVVGPDDKLYISGVNGNLIAELFSWIVAKFSLDGTVEWQRSIENTDGVTFAGNLFGQGGGSNLAVRQGYVALAGGFGIVEGNEQAYAAILQIPSSGNVFAAGPWSVTAANLSGTFDATASDIGVVDADLTDSDNALNVSADSVNLETEVGNFLVGTVYTAPGGDNSLVNGVYSVVLGNTGTVTLPSGGTITEVFVTSNPTIQLTPASPTVASQKLVIKGGGGYNYTYNDNGININYYDNTAIVGDTLTFYIYSPTYADQTLYWWIYPEGANISDPGSGTVTLTGSNGTISFELDSDNYEFTVRVSPEDNNYGPGVIGVESGLINADDSTFDVDHHLHLTTGDLTETSIFLGTDDHNVRTTTDGGIEITTPNVSNNVWQFGTDGSITFPDDTVQTTAYTGQGGGAGSLTDSGDVVVTAGSTAHWVATQRRNNEDTEPRGQRYDSQGNLYTLTQSGSDQGNITVITKYTAAGAVSWQRSFTDANATALAVDSNNCAYITLNVGGPEITVIKFSTAGSPLWKKVYEMAVPATDAFIEEKSATTLALAFSIQDGTPGPNGVVVMEINASTGAVEIKRQITFATPNDTVLVTGIDVDPDENVFVTGFYYDDGDEKNKMFIEKLDENLERVWSKSLETANTYNMYGGDCASDALGNIYVVGSYQVDTMNSGPEFTGPQSAGILAKLNSLGVVQWTRRLGPGPCGSFATGLTVTAAGNVYLTAVTFAKNTDAALEGYPESVAESFGTNKMIVVRYDTQGAVIWQRYVDIANLYEDYDDEQLAGQAVAVFGDKFAVAGYGQSWDNVPFEDGGSDDDESDYFVVQLPTDGTALTIGNLDFTESRVPARFITHTATTSPLDNTAWATSVTLSDSTLVADTETRIANSLVKSKTYDYTFGANGTLTIPNDGDLQLTQSQVGYLMAIGGSDNNDDDIYSRAVTVDSQGNMYVVGNEEDDNQSFVMKISSDGVRQWSVRIVEDSEGWNNRANGITIHPTTGNLMVVCEVYGDWIYSVLVTLDQDTGRILNTETFSDADSDVYLNDIAYTNIGDSTLSYVLGGSKYGEFTEEFPVTKQTGSTTGTILVLRSAVPGAASTSWQIGGTGFDVFENLAYVERYTGVTGTVRQGSGADFNIVIDGAGAIDNSSAVNAGGSNYRVGHKILIPYTAVGGSTNDADIIVTVTAIDDVSTGAITGTAMGYYGAGGGVEGPYNAVSGANYQTGSGLEFTFNGPRNTTNYDDYNSVSITAGGTNYVANDVVVVLGTSLGGTTPANDLTVTVGVSGTAVQYFDSASGTSQSTTWKLETTTQVNFNDPGSWLITYPLDRQNLLITPTWQRTFGTSGNDGYDRLYAVTVDTGNNIIAVGEGYGELAAGNFDGLAMVYKFNSTGTIQWAKQLNETNDDCYAKSVVTIGTDIYVTHDSNDNGDTVISKLDSTGAVKWQRGTDSYDDSSIARTSDGNLLVTTEAYNEELDQTALKVFLLTPSGETVYQRWLMATTDDNTQFKNGRCLAVAGDSYYISAYFYANSNTSSVAARLPIDGSGTGEYGSFRYVGVNAMTGSFGPDGLTGINYDINEIDLEDANNYAGALALVTDPYVNDVNAVTLASGDFFVDTFYPYLTNETVRDTDGGSIIFPDGTKQNTSATDIPQRRYWGQRYTLGLKDRGHHILCRNSGDSIQIPYWARVNFPIGTVITVVNTSGGDVYINQEGSNIDLVLAGVGDVYGVTLANTGIATLLMISLDSWIISGNVTESAP